MTDTPSTTNSGLFAAEQDGSGRTGDRQTDKPPVVLLHGFGGCHAIWRDIIRSLASSARMLAYDLPGHGQSLTGSGAGSARRTAAAILADLASRDIQRVHLVGHSMGGAIATLMAVAEPERVASLTLLAPGGMGEEINGALLRRYAAAVDDDEIRQCLAAMSGPQAQILDAALHPYREMRRQPGQTAILLDIVGMIARDGRQGVIPGEMLAALLMPVTVAWGDADPVLPFKQTENLPQRFKIRRLPGIGHMLVSEAPETVTELILAGIRPARPLP